MADSLFVLGVWHWLTLGVVLISLELGLVGAYFLLCSGIAALCLAGLHMFGADMTWQAQFGMWGVLSVGLIVAWSLIRKTLPHAHAPQSDEPLLNDRARQYVGRVLELDASVSAGVDVQQRVDDTYWTIRAPVDLKKGAKVKVVRAESTVLFVEAV